METYLEIRTAIFAPFLKEAEKKSNVSLSRLQEEWQNYEKIEEAIRVNKTAIKLYAESFSKNPDAVLQDAQKILKAIEKQDFLDSTERQVSIKLMARAKELGDMNEYTGFARMIEENPYNCIFFITTAISHQIEAMRIYENYKLLFMPIKEKLLKWYSFPESEIDKSLKKCFRHNLDTKQLSTLTTSHYTKFLNQLPLFHGKAIDILPTMNSKSAKVNLVGDLAVMQNNVKLAVEKFNSLSGTLSISTHKLLCKAISVFTEQNHAGRTTGIKSYEVSFPLKEYALQCGYDVEEHDTSTPEEAEQEKKRVKNTLDNFRKKVKKDLEMLYAYSLTWEEKVKGKLYDFDSMRIIGRYSIKKGIISVEFTVSMAEYMIQLTQTKYSAALFSIDDRKPNAYNIGWKMATHYNNDNNLIAGTANLLKVKTLLACTSLPDLETVRGTEHGWIDRIKEPFESALDVLTKNRVLADWRYSHSKGVEMTDTEATNFESYEDWANTLLYFELKDPHDHTERLARNADKKKEAKTKRTRKKKKSDE